MTTTENICGHFGEQPPNMNVETGIHYGVIPLNDLHEWATETFMQGEDMGYKTALSEFKQTCLNTANAILIDQVEMSDRKAIRDNLGSELSDAFDDCYDAMKEEITAEELAEVIFNACEDSWGYSMQDNSGPWRIEEDGVEAELHSDNDVWVFQSPFYTLAAECSPCAPNAGYLNSEGGVKTYCLGLDWFNKEAPCPYKVFRVIDDFELTSIPGDIMEALHRFNNNRSFESIMECIQSIETGETIGSYAFMIGVKRWVVDPDGYIHT